MAGEESESIQFPKNEGRSQAFSRDQVNHVAPSSLKFYLNIRASAPCIVQYVEIALELMPIVTDSSTIQGL